MSATTPSEHFHLPTDAAAREALAGEYVVGTVDAETAVRIAAAMQGDPAWRAAVQAWERRLAPLGSLVRPEPAPPDGWDRIAARITPYHVHVVRGPRLSWLWRGWAITATIAAAGFAALVALPNLGAQPAQQARLEAVLIPPNDRNSPTWLVDIDPKGQLRLTPVRATSGARAVPPPGKELQFWAIMPGATATIDLGLLPRPPAVVTIPLPVVQPVSEMILQISLEAEGGSKIGRPTGPLVFVGRLYEMGPPPPG
jgi:anti-sigma-K factor RskA